MNIHIITAGAGTGKTTRLAQLLDEAISSTSARPEAILATTFTKQAAAELQNRARTRLLQNGHGKEAQALLTARIGTVNAICGALVTDFALKLGLSPELRVLDEAGAELELERALASVVTDEVSDRLQAFQGKFDQSFDWHYEIRRLIEAARANGIDAGRMAASALRSKRSLDDCLGPVSEDAEDLDSALRASLEGALAAIAAGADLTAGTKDYCDFLRKCLRDFGRGRLRWGDWAKLSHELPRKKSELHAMPVQAVAMRHLGHPRLRADLHDLIGLMFEIAARGLTAYQDLKRARGLLDFVDQEVLALDLLERPDILEMLNDQLDLVLVDEFQDTSPLQLAIFLKLAKVAVRSVWVGDPKQAIFGFRGTDPALMDAAIESLVNPARDPDLVAAAIDAVTRQLPVETLGTSYRSRPALVDITNAVFARAFSVHQAMPEERVRLQPERGESHELGPALSHWPLSGPRPMNKSTLASGVAAGARELLATPPAIWDRATRSYRPATATDVAILCRTNDQCRLVSEALGELGVASIVARVGLLESAEAQVLMAGLRLWVDSRDRLAAATLVRILDHPDDPSVFVEKVLAEGAREWLAASRVIASLAAVREQSSDLDVLAAVDAVMEALDLRVLCASWGNDVQRTANLDALRAHASSYCSERMVGGDAPSIVGFLSHLGSLVQSGPWAKARSDTAARVGSDNAITVSTWHAAKGLEWPIVILFGLETVRPPQAYGVHVLTDRLTFDLKDPLGDRWIHFWPNPYTTSNQGGPVKDAYAQSPAFKQVTRQGEREALRVLYVGWTRARDQLVLAAQERKLCAGLLGTLQATDAGLIADPSVATAGLVDATWGNHAFKLLVNPYQPAAATPSTVQPGKIRTGRVECEYAAGALVPSSAPPRACRVGEPIQLGARARLRGTIKTDELGLAVHAFFAADDPARSSAERLAIASDLLERHRVTGTMDGAELMELGDRLWRWTRTQFGEGVVVRKEWPLGLRFDSGTTALGSADLIIEGADQIAIVDHKSLGLAMMTEKAEVLAGQLGCYSDAVKKARPTKTISTWVHLPLAGVVVPLAMERDQ